MISESVWNVAQMMLTGLISIGFWEAFRKYRERWEYRYQWSCPKCDFSIKSNFPGFIKTAMEVHHH